MLTEAQKEQIELGIKTLEDFRPRGTLFGDRIDEFRLLDPQLKGDFADGLLESEDTMEEFEDKIYQPPQDETVEEAKANSKNKKKSDDADSPFEEDKKSNDGGLDDSDLF